MAIVEAFDPRPTIRVKPTDQQSAPFRKFGFVEAIKELDPLGSLGLLDSDFKVGFTICLVCYFST